ncbi:MAG: four helix bundle protein [Eubacterium sp.]|nr:four helix bundle protein [Eubacterium sp.]
MKKNNIIEEKTFNFAKRIVSLYFQITNAKNEYVLSKQLLRCGTSIGANVAESQAAQSRNDFVSKLSIALKETNETKYWIKLLFEIEYISKEDYLSLINDCDEIYKILSSIILSSKNAQDS